MWVEGKGVITEEVINKMKYFCKEYNTDLLLISRDKILFFSGWDEISNKDGDDLRIGKCSNCNKYFFVPMLGTWGRCCGEGSHDLKTMEICNIQQLKNEIEYLTGKISNNINKIDNIKSNAILKEDIIRPGKLKKHPLAKILLENKVPRPLCNIILQFKCLLRDSGFDINSYELKSFCKNIKLFINKYPDKKYQFKRNHVNNILILKCIKPIFTLWEDKNLKKDMKLETLKWENKDITDMKIIIEKNTNILQDMKKVKKYLKEGDYNNKHRIGAFINACISIYKCLH